MTHDQAAVRVDYETVVVEDPDRPRSRDEVDVMHVRLLYGDGLRHKLQPGQLELSCELFPLQHTNVDILPEKLDGVDYCAICFTPKEIARALEAFEKRRAEADQFVTITAKARARRGARGYSVIPRKK